MSNPQGPSHNPADPPAWGKEPAGGWGQPNPDDERTQRVDPRTFAPGGGQPPAAPPQQGWNGPPPQQYGAPPQQQPYGGQQYGGQPQYGAPPQQPYPPQQQGWPQQGGPQPTQQWGGPQPGYPPAPPEAPAKSGRSKLPLILGGIGVLVVAAVLVLGFVTPGFFVSKVFDTAAVQSGVQKILTDSYGVKDVTTVTCGQNIAVTAGNSFTCDATIAGKPTQIPVRITSSSGDYEVGPPGVTHPVTVLRDDELRAAHDLFGGALFNAPVDDEGWAFRTASYAPGRTLGVHLDGALAGTATSFGTTTVVPGGAVLEAAAVTRVAVRADRTRRGVLSAMMRAQLDDVAERGEAVASLRATEARIYGRFGYGVATRGRSVRLRASGAGWRSAAPVSGSVRMLDPGEIIDVLSPLHERFALQRAGGITRSSGWWRGVVGRRVHAREPLIAAVHTGVDGDDGFVIASPGERDGFTRPLHIDDLHGADTAATAALWRFVRDIDLVGDVEADLRPLDEPLELLLADPRDCTVTGVADETWLRLVDVPTALAARSWAEAEPVLLAVHDPFLERNAGVYRIGDGTAERVGPLGGSVVPELECDAAALAMAYLGDRTPSELAATGWWTCRDEKALARAVASFATDEVPWCGTFF